MYKTELWKKSWMTKSYGKIWHVYEPDKASQHVYEPIWAFPSQGLSEGYVKRSLIVRMMEIWEVGSNERYVIMFVSLHIFVLLLSPMNFYWSIDLCASLLTNLLWWSFELLIAESHLCAGNLLEYFKDTLFSTIETYDV